MKSIGYQTVTWKCLLLALGLVSCGPREEEAPYVQQITCGVPPYLTERDTSYWQSYLQDEGFLYEPKMILGETVYAHIHDQQYLWESNVSQLNVYFMESSLPNHIIDSTLAIANYWLPYSGIVFVKAADKCSADIRVSFKSGIGYFSLLGRDAKKDQTCNTTMGLADLHKEKPATFRRVVLHEFGHALGLLHELQHPDNPIQWDTLEAIRHFMAVQKMTKSQIYQQIFVKLKTANPRAYDPSSIMVYAVPAKITKNKIEIPWPDKLSEIDKREIKVAYNRPL